MTDSIRKMIRKADKEKRKEAKSRRKAALKADVPRPPASVTPPDGERWAVYWALSPKHVTAKWAMGFAVSCGFFLATFLEEIFPPGDRYVTGGLLALFVLYFLYGRIWLVLTFPQFRTWRRRLPFELEGWEGLVDQPSFKDVQCWRDCTITLELVREDDAVRKALGAAAYLFCKTMMDKFYESKPGSPPREKWVWRPGARQLSGSANNDVAAGMYEFIRKPLAAIATEYGCITKVSITISGTPRTVQMEEIGMTP